MKKISCILLSVCMVLSMFSTVFAAETKTLTVNDITEKIGDVNIVGDVVEVAGNFKRSTIGFANVDLTGVKSITINAAKEASGINGEVFRIRIDDPNGLSIGEVLFGEGDLTARANIEEQTGVHTLYFTTTMYTTGGKWTLKNIVLHDDAKVTRVPTPDSEIIDNYSDTWAAVDDFGRKVADYEEVGPVKEGTRKVGIMYWHRGEQNWTGVIPEILAEHPDAWNNFDHPAWKNGGEQRSYWWCEPVLGFYESADYWAMRKHAVMLSNAGVDAVFFDFTNEANAFINIYKMVLNAFSDARKDGLDAPKVSVYGNMGASRNAQDDVMPLMYYNQVESGEYDDTVFYLHDKPMYVSHPLSDVIRNTEDKEMLAMIKDIDENYDLLAAGEWRNGSGDPNYRHVNWLEEFPQHPFGLRENGRYESLSLGVAINQSYITGHGEVGVFSDPTVKGRGYSEVFGEDYTEDGARKGYFFREASRHAVDVDPEFVFVDGWNELATVQYKAWGKNVGTVFIDTLDEENSRDFEPTRGKLKDDYYNMLVDFIRKYKGVRPAPVASAAVTIDINGAASQWDAVAPEFINDYDNFDRDYTGGKDFDTGEPLHYVSKVYNSISRAKAARDAENLYFYVKTVNDIQVGTPGWMNIYINIDRNAATGWNGYDFALNLNGAGVVSSYANGTWENIGTAAYTVQGNVLQMSVSKALLGETGVMDLEFKVTDNCITDGGYLDFYSEGSVAPMGKFNYLYTEIQQTALTSDERAALKGTTILKAGTSKVIIDGGKMPVYEKDTRVVPFEMNGTAYVPAESLEEILGYGRSKVAYTGDNNTLYISRYDLVPGKFPGYNFENYQWTYTVVGSFEARNGGKHKVITAPTTVVDGIVYVPLTYVSEVLGWNYQSMGNGIYVVSSNAIDTNLVSSVVNHIQ